MPADADRVFAGSIPELYERHLVPLIFEPFANDIARRVVARRPKRVLETAAGTGAVTRRLAADLPADATITATDLNQPMLDRAAAVVGTSRAIEWRQADATKLPFPDGSFDAVVCQFGMMFMPDKAAAFHEARRVLRDGGVFAFNVWDRIEDNEFADVVVQELAEMFPEDPPRFLVRTPHGYHDKTVIARDLARGGFRGMPEIATVTARSRASSPRLPAIALCQGTPMRGEIEARDATRLEAATDAAEAALARRFGTGPIDGRMQAHVVVVER